MIRDRLGRVLTGRLSPARTRRATVLEKLAVARLSWNRLVRLNVWLEAAGKTATFVWCIAVGATLVGIDWRDALESAVSEGRPLRGAVALFALVAIVVLLVVHTFIGWWRRRVQRELWRREVGGGEGFVTSRSKTARRVTFRASSTSPLASTRWCRRHSCSVSGWTSAGSIAGCGPGCFGSMRSVDLVGPLLPPSGPDGAQLADAPLEALASVA